VWTLETAAMALGLHAFGVPLSPFLPSLLVVLLALAFAVPITPGNVGPHQFLCVAVLSVFGIAEADALSFSIGFQGCSMAMVLLLGGISLLSEGLTTRQVWSGASSEATTLIVASPLVGGAVVESSPTTSDAT
jgi:uncharacterized membrane protein YbhN (UPF0104 family)